MGHAKNLVSLFIITLFPLCTVSYSIDLYATETSSDSINVEKRSISLSEKELFKLLCSTNAALGEKGNPTTTAFCNSNNISENASNFITDSPCKPLPSFSTQWNLFDTSLAEKLETAKQHMLAGLDNSSTAIFILGNTGSGKTTLAQILAGNLSRLYATETEHEELVIIDDENKIGLPITRSRTVIPEFLGNSDSQAAFWDCPGFDDNRGTDVDISAMYLLKVALDSATQAKFLFTVSYSSVKLGNDRLDFDNLVKHATKLLTNLNEVSESIGLVVTKVDSFSETGKSLNDSTILGQITGFLRAYVKTVNEQIRLEERNATKLLLKRKLKFAKILLGGSGTPTKVAFVRSPTKCGPLSESTLILYSRQKVVNLYEKRLHFTSVTPSYFQVTLRDRTINDLQLNKIPETIREIGEKVAQSATKVWNEFRENLDYQVKNGHSTDPLKTLTKVGNEFAYQFNQLNASLTSFSKRLVALYRTTNVNAFEHNKCLLKSIMAMEQQLKFFEYVLGHNIKNSAVDWRILTEPLHNIKTTLYKLRTFYEFCQKSESDLKSFESQAALGRLKINLLSTSQEDLLELIHKNFILWIPGNIEHIWNEKLSYNDKEFFVNLLKQTAPNTQINCVASLQHPGKFHLVVSGINVRFSEFVNFSKNWPHQCADNEQVKEISVYAFDTVFIDEDIDANCKTMLVSILAPNWQVIGRKRSISLECSLQQSYVNDAFSGSDYGDPGRNGKNGEPGINGGSFFGIFSNIVDPENLYINVNGGNGGDGQNGGPGYEGKPGVNATYDIFPGAYSISDQVEKGYVEQTGELKRSRVIAVVYNKSWRTMFGSMGKKGGNGGNGGDGGIPGNSGNIVLVNTKSNSSVNDVWTSALPGKPGKPGKGGEPGLGGQAGQDYSCMYHDTVIVAHFYTDCYSTINTTRESSGEMGRDGEFPFEVVNPEKPAQLWRNINQYKKIFFESRQDSHFILDLEQVPEIVKLLNMHALADEIESVEQIYFVQNGDNSQQFVQFYSDFLQRVKSFGKLKNVTATEDKIALNYIYAAALGKLTGMQNYGNTLKVVDTKGYFEGISMQLEGLKSAQQAVMIMEESAKFENRISRKTKEAENFIQKMVLPAIENAEKSLDQNIADLVMEVKAYLTAAENNVKVQREMVLEFENTLTLRYIFSGLKFIGTACQFLGKQGEIAGNIISEVSSVAENFLLKPIPFSSKQTTFKIPKSFENLFTEQFDKWFDEKTERVEKQVNLTLVAVNCSKLDISDLGRMAEETSKILEEFKIIAKNTTDMEFVLKQFRKLNESSLELEKAVNEKAQQFRKNGESYHSKSKKTMENLVTAMKSMIVPGQALVEDIQSQNNELNRLRQLVTKAELDVQQVERKKAAMFYEFLPVLNELRRDFQRESKNSAEQSLSALGMKRWKVQQMLRGMKRHLKEFTKGLKVEEGLQMCVDRLEEAITMLITLHEHMEQYQEKKELADYIANINSAKDVKAKIVDDELKSVISRMDFSITANLFIEEYQNALSAFKQWSFPFAGQYLTKSDEVDAGPEVGVKSTNQTRELDAMANFCMRKVQIFHSQIQKYYSSTSKGDESLIVAMFLGDMISVRPFYVWTNDKWHASVDGLLSGKQIHLKADPELEPGTKEMLKGKAAVKYKSVELKFRANEPNQQQELDEALKHFEMKMTHSGVSIYEVVGQRYVMFDANQTYRYSFERLGNSSEAVHKNVIQMKEKDFLMSPYTWWTFQLNDLTPESGIGFRELKAKFGGKVNLELQGEGIYLDVKHTDQEKLAELDLDKYYEPFDEDGDYFGRLRNVKYSVKENESC